VDRLLVLVALGALVTALIEGARLLAAQRLRSLRARPVTELWRALGEAPDGRPTVVAFSTPGCAVCRTAQDPALAALADRTGGRVRVVQVDAARRPEVARAFGVLTAPTTVVLGADGSVAAANHGFATTERLAEQLGVG
jgi:thioredoxin-like negative regulator of GroEL